MSVAKTIEISSDSPTSFDDAIKSGLAKAGETVHGIEGAYVKEQKVVVADGAVTAEEAAELVAGGFGEVRLGRDYTPGFSAMGTTDVMGYGLYGNWLTFTAGASGITTRVSNGIHYTGTFSGVTLRAMYATGETNDAAAGPMSGDKDINDAFGLSAVYAGGPLRAQGYYQEINDGAGDTVKQMGIGAGYNFGTFRITAAYGQADADSGAPSVAVDPGSAVSLSYRDIARRAAGLLSQRARNKRIAFPNIVIQNT